jgi:hypothetical protein
MLASRATPGTPSRYEWVVRPACSRCHACMHAAAAPHTPPRAALAVHAVHVACRWIFETYEQLMLCKYRARPHTGKNWERTFSNPRRVPRLRGADPRTPGQCACAQSSHVRMHLACPAFPLFTGAPCPTARP